MQPITDTKVVPGQQKYDNHLKNDHKQKNNELLKATKIQNISRELNTMQNLIAYYINKEVCFRFKNKVTFRFTS